MLITYGTNTAPLRLKALRASVCLAGLIRGLRVEKLSCFPSADMIQITGTREELRLLCAAEFKGARFTEHEGGGTTVHTDTGSVTAIVRRDDSYAIHV